MSENLIVIMSDEHNSKFLGSRGHPYVKTPNLDRLASMGTMFTNAYTPSPVCVPARASFATGRYVHDIEKWDNAAPFAGDIPSWHSILRDHQRPLAWPLVLIKDIQETASRTILKMSAFKSLTYKAWHMAGLVRFNLTNGGNYVQYCTK